MKADVDSRLRHAAGAAHRAVAEVAPTERLGRLLRRRAGRLAAATAWALTVLVAATGAGIVVARQTGLGPEETGTTLPATTHPSPQRPATNGRIVARIPVHEHAGKEQPLAFVVGLDEHDVWLKSSDGLVHVDPASLRRTTIVEPARLVCGGAIWPVGGALWVPSPCERDESDGVRRLVRVDPATGEVTELLRNVTGEWPGEVPDSVVTVGGTVWGTLRASPVGELAPGEGVVRLDPATGRALQTVPYEALSLATDGTDLVALSWDGTTAARIDPLSGAITQLVSGSQFQRIAVGGGAAWITSRDGSVTRVGFTTGDITIIPVGQEPLWSIAFGAGSAWVQDTHGQVHRIDPASNRVVGRVPELGRPGTALWEIAFAGDSLWASAILDGKPYLLKIDPYR